MTDGEQEKPPRGRDEDAGPLGFIVAGEAQRVLSDAQIEADPARVAEGWERRFVADGARAEEMIALYRELGFEVVADPIRPDHIGDQCESCQLLIRLQFKMIYTRRPR
ncbi:MAG: hypothetical protein A2V63_10090 [Candidatus Eisenbacteria bacterium RBG_19FT_COMBO_70_11]|nr:MAG: hypothetical protein A2V63_10090 [Candidatus Eisenbacteria bacterium RBG_19FT_COMBO_70_11]